MPLEDFVEKSLLRRFERSGKALKDINLLSLCNSDTETFGARNSAARREIQFWFKNLKKRTVRSYVALLERHQLPLGTATTELLRQEGEIPSPASSVSSPSEEDEPSVDPSEPSTLSPPTTVEEDQQQPPKTPPRPSTDKRQPPASITTPVATLIRTPTRAASTTKRSKEQQPPVTPPPPFAAYYSGTATPTRPPRQPPSVSLTPLASARLTSPVIPLAGHRQHYSPSAITTIDQLSSQLQNTHLSPGAPLSFPVFQTSPAPTPPRPTAVPHLRRQQLSYHLLHSPPPITMMDGDSENKEAAVAVEATEPVSAINGGGDTMGFSFPEGSIENPYVIQVDPRFPEAHREFDIEEVDAIQHGSWVRQGYHIRIDVGLRDKKSWRATMFQDHPDYLNRAILVQGLARKSIYEEVDNYHRKNFCANTKQKHIDTSESVRAHVDRHHKYWLLVFPVGTVLDNVILSGDPSLVTKHSVGVQEKVNDVVSSALMLYWVIARREGGYRSSREVDSEVANDDFA